MDRKTLRVGLTAILCAAVFRLFSPDMGAEFQEFLARPQVTAFLIYMETGRSVRFSASEEAPSPARPVLRLDYPAESPAPRQRPPEFWDASGIEMYYGCSRRPDLTELLLKPLSWDLADGAPRVLILHTHTTESYTKGSLDYAQTAPYRTLDRQHNMLCIGDRVAQILEGRGIGTVHDRTFHDYPSYNGSYAASRRTLERYLKEIPTLCLVLDIHRDAMDTPRGQLRTLTEIRGLPAAQLMLVMGTDAGGLEHPRWEENLSLALKLHAQLERQCPGIMRPLCLRSQRFNQDLCPGTLLVEVGAAGNSLEEALPAARELALGIAALAKGANVTEGAEALPTGNLPGI